KASMRLESNGSVQLASGIFSARTFIILGTIALCGVLSSPNAMLWAACVFTLAVAIWILGGKRALSVLVWIIAFAWLQVIGDVVFADLKGVALSDPSMGENRSEAIILSLCAISVLALGMRCGMRLSRPSRPTTGRGLNTSTTDSGPLKLKRVIICYFA